MGARLLRAGHGRRTFLGGLGVALWGLSRRLWGQGSAPLRYRPLARPVLVPLTELSVLWRARPFVAEAVTLAAPRSPRSRSGSPEWSSVPALAMASPIDSARSRCAVRTNTATSIIPPRRAASRRTSCRRSGGPSKDPLYLCPCHNSACKAENGECWPAQPLEAFIAFVSPLSAVQPWRSPRSKKTC